MKALAVPAFIAALWLALLATGYPHCSAEDLFFVGAPLHVAQNGTLANPLLAAWYPPTAERFFIHPPFFPWALGTWLRFVGVSDLAIRSFVCGCYLMASFGIWLAARKRGAPVWLAPAVVVFLAGWADRTGLRHDCLGLACLSWALAITPLESLAASACFGFLAACATLTTPVLGSYAFPLVWFAIFEPSLAKERTVASPAWHRLAAGVISGAAATGALFLAAISFHLPLFLSDFLWHARVRRGTPVEGLREVWRELTVGFQWLVEPLPFLLLGVLLVVAVRRRDQVGFRTVLACGTAGVILNLLLYPGTVYGNMTLLTYACIAAALAFPGALPLRARATAGALLAAAALGNLTTHSLSDWMAGHPDPGEVRTVRLRMEALKDRPLFIDEVAARYVYDYRLPGEARAWTFSRRPPDAWPWSAEERPPGAVWLVGLDKGDYTSGLERAPRLRLAHHEFRSIPYRKRSELLLVF